MLHHIELLEEREELGIEGKHGSSLVISILLRIFYQTDWQRWLAAGTLSHMHVAFSRDTDKKSMFNINC